jgi:hypothetical protein
MLQSKFYNLENATKPKTEKKCHVPISSPAKDSLKTDIMDRRNNDYRMQSHQFGEKRCCTVLCTESTISLRNWQDSGIHSKGVLPLLFCKFKSHPFETRKQTVASPIGILFTKSGPNVIRLSNICKHGSL